MEGGPDEESVSRDSKGNRRGSRRWRTARGTSERGLSARWAKEAGMEGNSDIKVSEVEHGEVEGGVKGADEVKEGNAEEERIGEADEKEGEEEDEDEEAEEEGEEEDEDEEADDVADEEGDGDGDGDGEGEAEGKEGDTSEGASTGTIWSRATKRSRSL